MESINRTHIGIRFIPLLLGIVVPLLIYANYAEMRGNNRFLPASTVISLAFSAANWFVFGGIRLWIRYLVFAIVFFGGPFLMWSLESDRSSDAPVFSMMGIVAVLIDAVIFVIGMRVVKAAEYKHFNDSIIRTDHIAGTSYQYSILGIFGLTLFIGITISAFLTWISIVGVDWQQFRALYAEPVVIALYLSNVVALLASLSKRKMLLWVILGAALTVAICVLEPHLAQQEQSHYYLTFLYFEFVAIFTIPRILGYHWIRKTLWKKRIANVSINEPPIIASNNSANVETIIGDKSTPTSPPVPVHPPGFQQIAEPPVVDSRTPPRP